MGEIFKDGLIQEDMFFISNIDRDILNHIWQREGNKMQALQVHEDLYSKYETFWTTDKIDKLVKEGWLVAGEEGVYEISLLGKKLFEGRDGDIFNSPEDPANEQMLLLSRTIDKVLEADPSEESKQAFEHFIKALQISPLNPEGEKLLESMTQPVIAMIISNASKLIDSLKILHKSVEGEKKIHFEKLEDLAGVKRTIKDANRIEQAVQEVHYLLDEIGLLEDFKEISLEVDKTLAELEIKLPTSKNHQSS